jgi:pimeloyl-ACP methyl ester carboxylesterase
VVPEDRSRPNGPSIRLAVAIFKSPDANPAPDPLIFLQGGPGGPIVHDLGTVLNASNNGVLVGKRDLILIDQRGTGYSHPALDCKEATQLSLRTLKQNLTPEQQVSLLSGAVRRCRDRLVRAGVNLDAYTTRADAADIADLRRTLGYRSVDVYGVSYGSWTALTMMRYFPAGIRSVVLDSVVPPRGNLIVDPSRTEARLFNLVFRDCAQSPTCRTRYPRLENVFYGLIDQLNARPVIVPTKDAISGKRYQVSINGFGLSDLVFSTPYITSYIPSIPKMIYDAKDGNYTLVSKVYGDVGFNFESFDLGTYLSVACSDEAPFTTRQEIAAAVQALPSLLRSYALTSRLGDLHQCGIWHVKGVGPSEKTAVRSAIPTLVLEGQYDPVTPPKNGQLVARSLSRSFYFEFPGTGHGVFVSNRCPFTVWHAFLNDPIHRPDASCIASMRRPF